MSVTQDIFLIY